MMQSAQVAVSKAIRVLGAGIATVLCIAARAEQPLDAASLYERLSPSVWTVIVQSSSSKMLGSAVAIGDGRLITNCHVLSGGQSIAVVHSNVSYGARLLEPDAERDLCLIAVENFHAAAIEIAPINSVKVGQRVITIGSPAGRENTLSDGLVSGLNKNIDGVVTRIQISAPISHGSSGGGLFDVQGKLIGITSGGVDPSQAENINVAIPAEWIRDVSVRAEAQLARRRQLLAAQSVDSLPVPYTQAPGQPQSGTALAGRADFIRSTASGTSVLVSSHAAWARNTCQVKFIPKITVVTSPLHGRLDIKEGDFKIASTSGEQCIGQPIIGAQVFYIPNLDFKGMDAFSYVSSGNPSAIKTAIVDVH